MMLFFLSLLFENDTPSPLEGGPPPHGEAKGSHIARTRMASL